MLHDHSPNGPYTIRVTKTGPISIFGSTAFPNWQAVKDYDCNKMCVNYVFSVFNYIRHSHKVSIILRGKILFRNDFD